MVRLLAGLREPLGASEVRSAAESVRALLDELADGGAEALRERLDSVDLRVLVNGRSIGFLDGLETRLEKKDTVTVHLSGARGYPGG